MGTDKRHVIYKAGLNDMDVEESDSLISRCFEISSDVEFKEVPMTGEEYLLKVIKERQNYAVVTKCDKDISKFAKNQSRFYEEPPVTKSAPVKLRPTIEWQKIQMSDFSDIRSYISGLLATKSKWRKKVESISIEDDTIIGWKIFFAENNPTLTCVFGLNPEQLDRGLEMLIKMIKNVSSGQTIDHKTGQWIYSFLACIKQPLLSETICILRDLARTCAEIRSKINQDDENALTNVAPLNLFICIVARFFEQYDLTD